MAQAIAETLGAVSEPGRPVLETLLDALASQNILIILDNCEHLVGACAKAADAILRRCSRVHLITTSREPLGINGEAIYRVPSLSLPGPDEDETPVTGPSDAVALFVDRAAKGWTSGSAARRYLWSCRSAVAWTGCPWPSSSPRPGSARSRLPT